MTVLERSIINGVRPLLSGTDQAIWDRQVASIYLVQRLPGDVEVNFYMRGAKDGTLPRFSGPGEFEIAAVKVAMPEIQASVDARVWVVSGRLFSIEYETSATYIEDAINMDSAPQMLIEASRLH